MKNLTLLSACLLLLACSDGGKSANPGKGGTSGGEAGTSGQAGTTGGAGSTGSAGSAGSAGGAGTTGDAGTTGTTGQGGTGGQSCTDIATAYSQAISSARMCPASNEPCIHLVTASLTCGCQTWVNDTTEIDKIQAQWTAAGCKAVPCPILCVNPGTRALCLPNDSGDWCVPAT